MSEFVNRVFDTLNGEPCLSLEHQIPDEFLQQNIKQQIDQLKSCWDCFQFNGKNFKYKFRGRNIF